MSIPLFSVIPSSLRPLTFTTDMDQLLSELNPWTQALNDKSNAFVLGLSATSTTNLTLATGVKNLTVQAGKGFVPGMDIVVASVANPNNRLLGTVTSYNLSTGVLVVDIYSATTTGAASASAWSISMTAAVDASAFLTPDGVQVARNKTLESPTLTGTPVAPTAAAGTNTTQVATTAFVQAGLALRAPMASPALTGTPTVPTAAAGTNTTQAASTAFVAAAVADRAPLASPALTGTPTAPTAVAGTNTTQLATTAFVRTALTALVNSSPAALDTLQELAAALGNDANFAATMTNALAAKAPLASPALTGTPTAPTAAATVNSTQVATTAFVQALAGGRRRFTAQGAIDAGKTVVLNGNGTVSPVAFSVSPAPLGPEQTPSLSGIVVQMLDVPGTNKVVLLTSTHLFVGTVDGAAGTTSWGAGTALPTGTLNRICWHPVENVVCMVFNNASALFMQLGTIAGNTITLGAAQSIAVAGAPGGAARYALAHNAHQNKIVVNYNSAAVALSVIAVHVANGVMTAGAAVLLSSAFTGGGYNYFAIAQVPGTPYMVAASLNSTTRQAVVLSLNASVITLGTAATITGSPSNSAQTAWIEFLPLANRFVLMQSQGTSAVDLCLLTLNPATGGAIPTLAVSTPQASTITLQLSIQPFAYDIGKGQLVFFGREVGNNYAVAAPASVSGNTLVLGASTYINTSTSTQPLAGYNSSEDRMVFAYIDAGNANLQTTRVWDTGDSVTNANDWVGITNEAIADGAQGVVITPGGICVSLAGLTTGLTYYIDDLGALQQSGSRRAGVALSATELLITGG